jgi:hypothetical protein
MEGRCKSAHRRHAAVKMSNDVEVLRFTGEQPDAPEQEMGETFQEQRADEREQNQQ